MGRRQDMVALLDFLQAESRREASPLFQRVSSSMIGAAGHSLGGYTLFGMAGGRESWRDDRLKAVLLLAPYILPYLERMGPASSSPPIMIQGGTWDLGVTPFLRRFYDQIESTKYYLILRRAGHFAWTDLNRGERSTTEALEGGIPSRIVRYSTAFFDRHLRGVEREEVTGDRDEALKVWLKHKAAPRKE